MKRFLPLLLLLTLTFGTGNALAQTTMPPPQNLPALAKDWESAFAALDTSLPPLRVRKPGPTGTGAEATMLTITNIYAVKAIGSLVLIKYKDAMKQNWSVVVSADQILGFYH